MENQTDSANCERNEIVTGVQTSSASLNSLCSGRPASHGRPHHCPQSVDTAGWNGMTHATTDSEEVEKTPENGRCAGMMHLQAGLWATYIDVL